MGMKATAYHWDFLATASTGGLKAQKVDPADSLSFYIETGPGCTATVSIQSRFGSSAGPYATLSTANLSTSAVVVAQHLGPLQWVRPYCVAKTTGVLTVDVIGNSY